MKFTRLRNRAISPIGVDVGSHSIKAVQLVRTTARGGDDARAWRLSAATAVRRSGADVVPDVAEVSRFYDVLERQGFHGSKLVLALPMDKLLLSVLELPPRSSGAPIEQMALADMARTHKCAPGSIEMRAWDLPCPARAAKSTQLMALACEESQASAWLDPFEHIGLDVLALDAQMLALARGTRCGAGNEAKISALLDLGWRSTAIALLYQGAIVYCRLLPELGLSRLQNAMMDRMHMEADVADFLIEKVGLAESSLADTPPIPTAARGLISGHFEAVSRELEASVAYVLHQYPNTPLADLTLCGGGGAIPGLSAMLSKTLECEARVADAGSLVDCPEGLGSHASASAFAVAIGLAQFQESGVLSEANA